MTFLRVHQNLVLQIFVIPAQAGNQFVQRVLDSRLRGNDGVIDFLREYK
jgi:hypothetical protein